MKIGIMGTHGAGKSGFALRMASKFKDDFSGEQVGLVSEVVRSCPFPVNRDTTEIAQRWLYHRQMLVEIEQSARNETLFCDRTVLDSLAYSAVAGFDALVSEHLPAAISWMHTYDELYWVRPGARPPEADGFRDTDRDYQVEIDKTFGLWVREFDLPAAQCVLG